MNYLAFTEDEWDGEKRAVLIGARASYVREFHKISRHDEVWCVVLGVGRGVATCLSDSPDGYEFSLSPLEPEPAPLPITLYQGLCRPQTIKKVLQLGAMLRLDQIVFFRSERGEKSYQQSKLLRVENQLYELIKGCEQVGNPYLPRVEVRTGNLLKCLNAISNEGEILGESHQKLRLVAAPAASKSIVDFVLSGNPFPSSLELLIGPEAGFSEEEVLQFSRLGFQPITLGRDHLRVEGALQFVVAQVTFWRSLAERTSLIDGKIV